MKFIKKEESLQKGPSKYLSFKDGEVKSVAFKGDIYSYYIKWVDGKSHVCGEGDPGAKHRYKINAIVREGGELVAKIFEFGQGISNDLADIQHTLSMTKSKIENFKVKISKSGSGLNTEWTVKLDEEIKPGSLDGVELNDLDLRPKFKSEPEHRFSDEPMPDEHDQIPF